MATALRQWKVVPDFPNYMVSSEGDVFSLVSSVVKAQHLSNSGYRKTTLYRGHQKSKCCQIHALVADAFLPKPESTRLLEIDHRDRNKHNNRVDNLRWVTKSLNQHNRAPMGQYRGVTHNTRRGVWRAQISVCGVKRYLGSFKDPRDAAVAYDRAAVAAYGADALLNVVASSIVT